MRAWRVGSRLVHIVDRRDRQAWQLGTDLSDDVVASRPQAVKGDRFTDKRRPEQADPRGGDLGAMMAGSPDSFAETKRASDGLTSSRVCIWGRRFRPCGSSSGLRRGCCPRRVWFCRSP